MCFNYLINQCLIVFLLLGDKLVCKIYVVKFIILFSNITLVKCFFYFFIFLAKHYKREEGIFKELGVSPPSKNNLKACLDWGRKREWSERK